MSNKICQYCEMEINETDAVTTCPKCGKSYHKECWEISGGCQGPHNESSTIETQTSNNNQTNNSVFCTKCGTKNVSINTFCVNCGAKIIKNENKNENYNSNNNSNASTNITAISTSIINQIKSTDLYVDITKHILLLIFTLGIYYGIWISKVTKYTNELRPNELRDPNSSTLMTLFLPFYSVFWYKKTAEIIFGNNEEKKSKTLLYSIFIPVAASALIQTEINKSVEAMSNSTPKPTPNPAPNSAPVQVSSPVSPSAPTPAPTPTPTPTPSSTVVEEIKIYKDLLDIGIITKEEFEQKKKEILNL